MKAIGQRLRRLEDRFGLAIESEFSRHLCELLEARERRAGLQPFEKAPQDDVSYGRRTIMEVLNTGRQRAEVNR
jgi:hypothetical protein